MSEEKISNESNPSEDYSMVDHGYMYSVNTRSFYPKGVVSQQPYVDAGSLPDDLLDISNEDYINFFNPPVGYFGVFDEQGPHLEKLPDPDYLYLAQKEKDSLIDSARDKTYFINMKIMMGRKITQAESDAMNAWLDYIDKIESIDLTTAPNIEWPSKP